MIILKSEPKPDDGKKKKKIMMIKNVFRYTMNEKGVREEKAEGINK